MMQVIPAVDVLGGQVVRLLRGDYEQVTVYHHEPAAMLSEWRDQGAELVHVVDLDGARTGKPYPELWVELARSGVPFQLGGGIRDLATMQKAISAGAKRVVMGTALIEDEDLGGEISDPERLVAAIDIADGLAKGEGWLDAGKPYQHVMARLSTSAITNFLVTSIVTDGTMIGPDYELYRRVLAEFPDISLIASGGVGELDHLRKLAQLGCEAVILGKALYEKRFSLSEAIAAAVSG